MSEVAALPRRLGMWAMVAVIMGTMIGSGIFRTPASIAEMVGSVGAITAVWVIGGLVTICLALCLAELGAMFPRSGGIFVFLHEAFGPIVAFVFGFTFLLVNPSQWAAIALIFSEYLGSFVPLDAVDKRVVATALILFVSVTNYFSVGFAAAIQGFATSAKALALAGIAIIIFLLGSGTSGALAQPVEWSVPSIGVFGVALIAVLWPYEGVAGPCAMAGEVRDPARNVPRALIVSVLVVMALYLLVNAAYLYVLPVDTAAKSGLIAADAMSAVAGGGAAAVIAACVMLSTFGAVSATSMADPRVFYAMARDGLFFRRIGAVHPRFATPHVAILLSGATAIAYLWVRTFEELAAQFVIGMWLFYTLAVIGLIKLRIQRPQAERPYRVPGYPVVPIVFVIGAAGLLANSLWELPGITTINLAVMAVGIPVYFVWQRARAART
ncbi:MAG TPA: amino acid permease [Steroidobacteraceae bacterium]|nr:amino acid permease [Steroidobacteraceae bacterium]